MLFFQRHSRKSVDTTPPSSDADTTRGHRASHRAPQQKRSKSGNTHSAKNATDISKSGPRGRTVSHPTHISRTSAPNSVSSTRKTRSSSTSLSHSVGKPINPSLLNDPAFSTDPRSNPHHSMTHHGTHFSASDTVFTGAIHSKKQAFYFSDDGHGLHEYRLRQPPNSPQDAAPEYFEASGILYGHPQSVSQSTPSPPSLSSTSSTASHTSSTSSTPQTPPTHTALPASTPDSSRMKAMESSPLYEPRPVRTRPALLNSNTTPDLRQAVDRSVLPRQPVTSSGNHRTRKNDIGGIDNTRYHTIPKHGPRIQELDRIDELDETDPLGLPWHHGGPYEAIHKLSQERAYQAQSEGHPEYGGRKDRSHKVSRHVRNGVVGVSLNLAPGQILPHIPEFDPRSLIPPHPLLHKPHDYNKPYDSQIQGQTQSFPQDVLPPMHPQFDQSRDPSSTPSRRPIDVHRRFSQPIGRHAPIAQPPSQNTASIDSSQERAQASPEPIRNEDLHDHRHHSSRRVSDQRAHHQHKDRSTLQVPASQHNVAFNDSSHAVLPRSSEVGTQSTDMSRQRADVIRVDRDRLASHEGGAFPTDDSGDDPSSNQSQPPSMKTSSSSHWSSSTRSRNEAPKHHHLPKHLVMPKPLQQQQPSSSLLEGGPKFSTHLDRTMSRDKASSQPRAREIPMQPESRKLVRKRTNVPNRDDAFPLFAPTPSAVRDINIEATLSRPMPKRVLSKRPNDF